MADPRHLALAVGLGGVAFAGALLIAGLGAAIVTGVVGLAVGIAIGFGRVRPAVAVSVGVGAIIGFALGRSVVHVLCAPAGCVTAEWIGGLTTGVGALVGVGLVVALATRSFEEYNEAIATQRQPPTAGCESDETADST